MGILETVKVENNLLKPGELAPDFSLQSAPGHSISLRDFQKTVALMFYPADWSPCGDQLALYNEVLPEFTKNGVTLLGISVDSAWSHLAFAKDRKLKFPLLSDFEPKGAVSKAYGAYDSELGVCTRSLLLIRPDGLIQWSYQSPLNVNPGADELLEAIESLVKENQKEATAWYLH